MFRVPTLARFYVSLWAFVSKDFCNYSLLARPYKRMMLVFFFFFCPLQRMLVLLVI